MDNYILIVIVDNSKYYYLGTRDDGLVGLDTKQKNAYVMRGVDKVEHVSKVRDYFNKMGKEVEIIPRKVK